MKHIKALTKREKAYLATVIALLLVLIIPLSLAAGDRHRADVKRLEHYRFLMAHCISKTQEARVLKVGDARSPVRGDAVVAYFAKLVAAPCLTIGTRDIYNNPYKGVRLESLSQTKSTGVAGQVLDGVLYDYDYNIGAFLSDGQTLCDDGWISNSRGRGTCSHHGGYAHQRGIALDYQSGALIHAPTSNTTQTLSPTLISVPLATLWEAIFTHLFHHPHMPLSLLGFLIFLLVATWPFVILGTLVKRQMARDRELAIHKVPATARVSAGVGPGLQPGIANSTSGPTKLVRKRPRAPKMPKPESAFDNYKQVAWVRADEVSACVRAAMHGTDQAVPGAPGAPAAWIRVRGLPGAAEYGLERHRATGVSIIGWFTALEIDLMRKALEEKRDCQSAEKTAPEAIKIAFVAASSPAGIAGQDSVRLYRLRGEDRGTSVIK